MRLILMISILLAGSASEALAGNAEKWVRRAISSGTELYRGNKEAALYNALPQRGVRLNRANVYWAGGRNVGVGTGKKHFKNTTTFSLDR